MTAGAMGGGFTRRAIDAWAGAAGLGLFAICVPGALHGTVSPSERAVFDAINELPGGLEPPMFAAQFLGVLVIGPLVAIVALVLRRYRLALAAVSITVIKLVAERIVWRFVERERPGTTVPGAIVRGGTMVAGDSFVSGHVMLVTALAWAVSPYLRGRWRLMPWLVVATVGLARIYLGAHNPLDVAGGLGLGLAIGGAVNLAVGVPAPEPAGDVT